MKSTQAAETASPSMPEFQMLSLTALVESPHNNRKHYDPKKLEELTDSIRQKGVLTPLLARPSGNDGYEIAAGHRRYRAAKAAGVELVPVLVREMSDAEFIEVLTIENVQREDVHPLDEANGYKELIEKHGYTAETIAGRTGKSISYVYQRLKLSDLIGDAQKLFFEEAITAGHAILIARLPEVSQKAVLKDGLVFEGWNGQAHVKEIVSVRTLNGWIQNRIHLDLSKVPFDIGDPALLKKAGACLVCPKRTGAAPALFEDVGGKDHCMDRACYNQKVNAFVDRAVADGDAIAISSDYGDRNKKGIHYLSEYGNDGSVVKAGGTHKKCESMVKGIYVNDRNRGIMITVCSNRSCKAHFGKSSGNSARHHQASPAEQLATAKANINATIESETRRRLYKAATERLDLIGADLSKIAKKPVLGLVLRLVYDRLDSGVRAQVTTELGLKKSQYSRAADDKELDKYAAKMDPPKLMALIVRLALKNLSEGFSGAWNRKDNSTAELADIADQYGVKTKPILEEVGELKKEKLAKAVQRVENAKKAKSKTGKKSVQTSAGPDPDDVDVDVDEEDLDA